MFSRAFGSAAPTSVTTAPRWSRPRSKMRAASRALSTTDSARGAADSTSRSTTPLCDSSHCPSVNGALALDSMGIPTVADRTAATTHPLDSAGATDAKDASPHSGAALRQRRGAGPSKKPTPQPSAFISPCSAGAVNRTAPEGRSPDRASANSTVPARPANPDAGTSDVPRQPDAGEDLGRTGWSQLRKLGRRMSGATAQDPPRSTRYSPRRNRRRTARCSGRRSSG